MTYGKWRILRYLLAPFIAVYGAWMIHEGRPFRPMYPQDFMILYGAVLIGMIGNHRMVRTKPLGNPVTRHIHSRLGNRTFD